jgi:hypothetical protein
MNSDPFPFPELWNEAIKPLIISIHEFAEELDCILDGLRSLFDPISHLISIIKKSNIQFIVFVIVNSYHHRMFDVDLQRRRSPPVADLI